MSMLRAENLIKTFGEKKLFDNISFTIGEKERIGLIGVNGTGKSTLLKVLAGIEGKEAGELFHANHFEVEYLAQEPDLDNDLTVLEQVYFGNSKIMKTMRKYEEALIKLEDKPQDEALQKKIIHMQQVMDDTEAWEANTVAKTILTKLGITEFTKKTGHLSGGQKKRVALAKALIQPVDLLLLDEPTNHLDNETIEWMEQFLTQYKGTILLITHDRYFLNRVTNRIFELANGLLYEYEGNYELYLEKKAEREEQEVQKEVKHRNLLRRELSWLQRGARARSTKQKAHVQRVEKLKEETFTNNKDELDFSIGSTRLGKKVIELKDVQKKFAEKNLFKDLNILINQRDRIGIIGPNGAGKTTLLNIIAGKEAADSGQIEIGETVKIGYYTQEHEELDEDMRMIDSIKEVAEVVYTADGATITAEQMLERFLFPRFMHRTLIRRLSGGERKRLYLLKVLMEEPNVLFLDEPTNDLDTQTLSVLEDYLDQFPGVVITISHDRYFLDRVVADLMVLDGKGNMTHFQGSYSDWLEKNKIDEEKKLAELKVETVNKGRQTNKRKKLSYNDQQEWDGIEERIAHLEEGLATIERAISEAGSDIDQIRDLYEKQKELEATLEETMDRWEELALLVEEINQE